MKFKAKISDVNHGLEQVFLCGTNIVQKECKTNDKITLSVKGGNLNALANNGAVAINKTVFTKSSPDFSIQEDGDCTTIATDLKNSLAGFSANDICNFVFEGNKITISSTTRKHNQVSVSDGNKIDMPELKKKYDNEITMDREVFLSCAKKVCNAVSDERSRPALHFWKMQINGDKVRLVAGSGARYIIYDRDVKGFMTAKEKSNIFFAKEYASFLSILEGSEDTKVVIKDSKMDKKEWSDQICISVDGIEIILIGYDPGQSFLSEKKLLDLPRPSKAITLVEDWKDVVKGINAVYNKIAKSENTYHYVDFDLANKQATYSSDTSTMSSNGSVELKDTVGSVKFRCEAKWISETFSNTSGLLQLEFISGDKPMPVVIRCFAGEKISDGPFESSSKEQLMIMISQCTETK